MKRLSRLLVLLLTFAFSTYTYAQQDTEFWFAAPEVSSGIGDSPVNLRFTTYAQAATITVSQPANGAFVPLSISLGANTSGTIDLTSYLASIESPAANVISNNGIHISSTAPIRASYEVAAPTNKETFALKGNKALGTDFYIPMQKSWNIATTTPASYSGFEIVATQNNTTVLITPRAAIVGHAVNATFSIVLNAGQTYSARDMDVSASTSLSGSIVASDKPIAITIVDGALTQGTCSDLIGDQLIPSQYLGTNFAVYKGTSNVDRVFILAVENGSAVTITGAATSNVMLSTGESHTLVLDNDVTYISSTKPLYIYHVTGFGCELSSSIVPSLNCKGNNQVNFSRTTADSLGMILITRAGFEGNFLVNGTPGLILPSDFVTVPGTSGVYVAARKFFNTTEIAVNNTYSVENNTDIFTMSLITGNNNAGASYHYLTEFYATAFANAGVDDTVCANQTYTLQGLVGGGAITGTWSTNGFGSFQNGTASIPNTYIPSPLDTLISPIRIILSTGGSCPVHRDTLYLEVTPSPMVNANTDQTICINNSLVELNGVITGGATTGIWSTTGTGQFVPDAATLNATYIPSSQDLSTGSLTFTLTSTNAASCAASSDNMLVQFTPAPLVNAGPDTLTVCANNASVSLSGSVSGPTTTGKWTTSGTGLFTPNNSSLNATYTPSIADTTAGFVWLYLESTSNGNCLTVKDSIYVLITDAPKVDAGPNQLICSNVPTVQLNATINSGSFGVVWSGGSGSFTPSNTDLNAVYTPSAADVASGSVVLTLTSTNNGLCSQVSDPMQINFVSPPFANFSVNSVCEGNSTNFTDFSLPGSGTINYWSWTFESGQTSSSQHTSYTFGNAGVYPVQLIVGTTNGCRDTVLINAVVYDKPEADFISENSCPNNQMTVSFTDASTSDDALNYWFYDFGGQGSGAFANMDQVFNAGGTYSITHIVSTVHGCSDTIVRAIVLDPLPDAGFYLNSTSGVNVGSIYNFIDTSLFAISHYWDFGDGNISTQVNPTHTYFANGNYYVILKVENNLGCMDSAIRFISINNVTNQIQTLIPTVISPNGDGLNDVWKLDFLNLLYPNAHIEIYNEWGQTVFTSDGYDVPWDGTYNNEPVPDGNYMYVIQLNANESPDLYKGVLMVLRKRG